MICKHVPRINAFPPDAIIIRPLRKESILIKSDSDLNLSRCPSAKYQIHIYLKHPVFGIGLRPYTHGSYLKDYHNHQNLRLFSQTVKDLQTFDNMLLTSFVELGTLMTLAYLALIALIIIKYCRKLQLGGQAPLVDLYRLAVLIGWAVHSMTYDSLVFPSINWLFHVQLGILAAYSPATGSPSPDHLKLGTSGNA